MMTMTNKYRTAAAMALWPLAMAAQATGMDDDSGDGSMLGFALAILTAAWLYYKYKKMQRKQAEEQARKSVDLQAMQAK
jgi:LPXTG-motif cell wall-anchored protein